MGAGIQREHLEGRAPNFPSPGGRASWIWRAQLELALDAAQEAEAKGDFEGAKRWYTEAASLGDVDAMRALIDEYDEHNLFQNWVWVFLSELLGHDLRESSLRAYHDGGLYADQDYDDDQGGRCTWRVMRGSTCRQSVKCRSRMLGS